MQGVALLRGDVLVVGMHHGGGRGLQFSPLPADPAGLCNPLPAAAAGRDSPPHVEQGEGTTAAPPPMFMIWISLFLSAHLSDVLCAAEGSTIEEALTGSLSLSISINI